MGKDGKMHFINTFLNMNRLRVKKVIATIVCVTILLSACNGGISSPNSSTKEEPNMESLHALYYDRLIQAAEEAFREQVEDPDLLEAFPYLPALYTYVSPEGETVYLFGTSQAYDPDTPWFPDYVKYALEESRCVITAHPEVNYSKEDLAYAEECMAQSPVGFSDELLETLETYREKRGLAGPEITQVRPLYWFLAKKWEWPEMQMNDVIWNMAEGKERVLAYDGKDVIDRMNQLDTKTEAILVVSGMARNSNSDRAMSTAINRYGKWLVYGYYGNLYTDDWWDDRFFCDGIPENGEEFAKVAGVASNTSCNGANCAETHFADAYQQYQEMVFQPNCQDILKAIQDHTSSNPVFVAVDLAYLYEVACGLVRAGWEKTAREPILRDE